MLVQLFNACTTQYQDTLPLAVKFNQHFTARVV